MSVCLGRVMVWQLHGGHTRVHLECMHEWDENGMDQLLNKPDLFSLHNNCQNTGICEVEIIS